MESELDNAIPMENQSFEEVKGLFFTIPSLVVFVFLTVVISLQGMFVLFYSLKTEIERKEKHLFMIIKYLIDSKGKYRFVT